MQTESDLKYQVQIDKVGRSENKHKDKTKALSTNLKSTQFDDQLFCM